MKITSAKFVKGVAGTDAVLEDGTPQIALIGRSNVGKSSLINSLANHKGLAKTSSYPGLTQEINVYRMNDAFYLLDMPGYGFARVSGAGRERLKKLIYWYLFDSPYEQRRVALVVDAEVGPTDYDIETLEKLQEHAKNIVVVANKVDKIRSSDYKRQIEQIQQFAGSYPVIPYSSKERLGVRELSNELFGE